MFLEKGGCTIFFILSQLLEKGIQFIRSKLFSQRVHSFMEESIQDYAGFCCVKVATEQGGAPILVNDLKDN